MNSLNILSSISSTTPGRSRTPSLSRRSSSRGYNADLSAAVPTEKDVAPEDDEVVEVDKEQEGGSMFADEQTALLGGFSVEQFSDTKAGHGWRSLPNRISSGIVGAVKVVVTWILSPCTYIIAYFYDEQGRFSPALPLISIARALTPKRRKRAISQASVNGASEKSESLNQRQKGRTRTRRAASEGSESSAESEKLESERDSPARNTRSKSSKGSDGEDNGPSRRSIRIKFNSDDALRRRRRRQDGNITESKEEAKELAAASLKSPSSPTSLKITKFPRTPQPPRPLVPRRQPSYSKLPTTSGPHQKTLILDLDETLIHSVSKGGRYATGHMVEVRMPHPVGYGGVTIGPEVPILYYVHKRPYCDEFLRKVSKWYNLVIFTASVPQYADPVIDWLEMEKKYFSARYYRQHCTYRNGAYIKDLSQIEDDLRNVIIIDNTPQCYIFHEDNAVPIEGWINDPTDYDLMHLIPLLEGLQYTTDVRALLALRLGQPQVEAA